MSLVKFATGTSQGFASLATKDANTLYFLNDTLQMYKGDKLYTKSFEVVTAKPETGVPGVLYVDSVNNKLYVKGETGVIDAFDASVIGTVTAGDKHAVNSDAVIAYVTEAIKGVTGGGVVKTITAADKSIDVGDQASNPELKVNISAQTGNSLSLKDDGLFVEVPEVTHPEYTVVKDENAGEYAAVYHLTKDGVNVGAAINIPKDIVVKEGYVEGSNLILVLNNEEGTKITIPVGDLIEYVTGGETDEIAITVDPATHVATATIKAGSIAKSKLAADVQASLDKADAAAKQSDFATLQQTVNGHGTALETLNGDDTTEGSVAKALKDAKAYTDTRETAIDGKISAGVTDAKSHANTVASTAEGNAKAYADGKFEEIGVAEAKANAAQAAAEATAAADATSKANTAESNAKTYADGLAKNYDAAGSASAAQAAAISAAAADAATKADNAKTAAVTTANAYTDAALTWGSF